MNLYQHIRKYYPNAILFEEVLFERTQENNIKDLIKNAIKIALPKLTWYGLFFMQYKKEGSVNELLPPHAFFFRKAKLWS